MKKLTKKAIHTALKTLDQTTIFKAAKLCGVDVDNKIEVYRFAEQNAPNKKVEKAAYSLACKNNDNKRHELDLIRCRRIVERGEKLGVDKTPIKTAVNNAKWQKVKTKNSPYFKILIEGNNSIYWASPDYGHKDYNKYRAFENNEKNRKIMSLINTWLSK